MANPNKKYPMRLSPWEPGWMDMTPALPVPKTDWIKNKVLNVKFGDHPLQAFDLYYPNDMAKEKYPLLIMIHGGGWSFMDKADWDLYPGFFALARGFALIGANYRLAPKHKFPAAFDDVNAALEYVIAHQTDLKIDLQNLFFWGTSAGGNLAAMLSLKYAADPRIRIGGVAAVCPALNFCDFFCDMKEYGFGPSKPKFVPGWLIRSFLKWRFQRYTGSRILLKRGDYRPYDASYYLTGPVPPFYFQYGKLDPLINWRSVENFAASLREKGLAAEDCVLDLMDDAAHMGSDVHYFIRERILRYIDFFERRIRNVKENNQD
jgi:acetyl esterase/lipase